MSRKFALAFALTPLLAACVAPSSPRPRVEPTARPPVSTTSPRTGPETALPARPGFRAPKIMDLPGVEGLIGAPAARLTQQFGPPRLDVYEGDTRKLQFSGDACVLDIYLYPTRPNAEPTATYVDARRASDGRDVDRVDCIRALLKR